MTGLKIVCALLLTSALASPAWAAPGDAGSGPTTGATSTNDAGSGATPGAAALKGQSSTTNSQSSTNGETGANGQTGMNNQTGTNGQTGTNNQTGMNGGQNAKGPGGMKISQRLKNDLGKAGFTDIKIMPQSFLVQAKDSQGNPVVMMINPNSLTAITEETQSTNSASNANRGQGNNTGATPGPSSTGGEQPVTPGGATKP
jgi:hypothetical protein